MTKTVKAFLILSLILGYVSILNSGSLSANKIERQVLDMGGAMWQTTSTGIDGRPNSF